jgi:ferritin-like metal-binding protein YciE
MAKLKSMNDLFIENIKDLYDAEKQIVKALPKMAKHASTDALKQAFMDHLEQTKGQVERLERVFEELELPARGKKCAGMHGLLEEGEELIGEGEVSPVLDAGMIGAAQKVEHYEIAAYGTARTFAQTLGHEEIARLLEQTLEEEKATDQKLTTLAESTINQEAVEVQTD